MSSNSNQIIQNIKEHYGYTAQSYVIAKVLRELSYEVRVSWH